MQWGAGHIAKNFSEDLQEASFVEVKDYWDIKGNLWSRIEKMKKLEAGLEICLWILRAGNESEKLEWVVGEVFDLKVVATKELEPSANSASYDWDRINDK